MHTSKTQRLPNTPIFTLAPLLLAISKAELNHLEKRTLDRAILVCYSSEWAAHPARAEYGASADTLVVIPIGSNYPSPLTREQAATHQPAIDGTCRLFLLGGEWGRKSGPIAYATMEASQQAGIPATLTVVGCAPPDPENYPNLGLITFPYLNMGVPADKSRLHQLFSTADFFLMPFRAECKAIAFCDANALGLPMITTDVGDISSFVQEGINGYMLPLSATGEDFSRHIQQFLANPVLFSSLRQQSRTKYEKMLN